jgi:glyoxylase-like metal-dependent hydrolase (beta-lactamase superfamily II)/rhodanese-related sulfurtransferase
MKIEQIYTGCLAQGAYYIESNGEAVVIDPLREVQPYLDLAEQRNAKIKYIFETHFHADFVSGHIDLAEKTNAQIVFGPTDAATGFDFIRAKDGQIFKVGDIQFRLIHTPGHTLESSCYLLEDESAKPIAIFTGDTLFIGDVGRPDLAQKLSGDLTQEKLAGLLYDSLRNKIMHLPDDLIVYPAHGAGSACGKNMSKETSDTLGNQKKTNYALNPDLSKEEFINEVLTGLTTPPNYFPKNVLLNIQGYDRIDEVIQRGTKALTAKAFELAAQEKNILVLDTRSPQVFAKGFVPGSINIGIDGSFAVWVGTLIPDIQQHLLIIAEPGRETEVVTRLARVGYDHAIGFLEGGMESWIKADKAIDQIPSVDVGKFAEALKEENNINILDVRKKSEYDAEHIKNVENTPLDFINESMSQIDKNKRYYVHCAGGYRSMIFCSILKARGYDQLIDVAGGFAAIKKSQQFELTEYVCPSTLL